MEEFPKRLASVVCFKEMAALSDTSDIVLLLDHAMVVGKAKPQNEDTVKAWNQFSGTSEEVVKAVQETTKSEVFSLDSVVAIYHARVMPFGNPNAPKLTTDILYLFADSIRGVAFGPTSRQESASS